MIGLAQIASTLEALSDVVTTNLVSLGHQRLAEGIDLAQLKDDRTSEFADAVIRNLEQSIAAVDQADRSQASKFLVAKGRIQELAESAGKSVLAKLQLLEKKDVVSFSLATDLIEQFKQIAHLARIVEEWTNHKANDSSPGGRSAPNEAAGAESKQDLEVLVKASRKSD
jgi:Na+/phosphate symporter